MIAMKIMIVEDEENIRDGIRNLVDWNQEGFEEPLLFSSAVEALVFLETETVDVVLTDLYMPVLNGIEFIRMRTGCMHFIRTGCTEKPSMS